MMLSHIVPTKWIGKWSGDFIMALACYIDDDNVNDYEKAIVASGKPVILDNGAFETGMPDGIDSLIRKALRIKARFVYAPDHFYDAKATERAFEMTCYIRDRIAPELKIGAIVQANNFEDYLKLYSKFEKDSRVHVIGLSYKAISESLKYETRREIPRKKKDAESISDYTNDRLLMLERIAGLDGPRKKCHLLGLGASFEDVLYAKLHYPWVILNDTSTCFMAGLQKKALNHDLSVPGGKIEEKIKIHTSSLSPEQIDCINENILKVNQKICRK